MPLPRNRRQTSSNNSKQQGFYDRRLKTLSDPSFIDIDNSIPSTDVERAILESLNQLEMEEELCSHMTARFEHLQDVLQRRLLVIGDESALPRRRLDRSKNKILLAYDNATKAISDLSTLKSGWKRQLSYWKTTYRLAAPAVLEGRRTAYSRTMADGSTNLSFDDMTPRVANSNQCKLLSWIDRENKNIADMLADAGKMMDSPSTSFKEVYDAYYAALRYRIVIDEKTVKALHAIDAHVVTDKTAAIKLAAMETLKSLSRSAPWMKKILDVEPTVKKSRMNDDPVDFDSLFSKTSWSALDFTTNMPMLTDSIPMDEVQAETCRRLDSATASINSIWQQLKATRDDGSLDSKTFYENVKALESYHARVLDDYCYHMSPFFDGKSPDSEIPSSESWDSYAMIPMKTSRMYKIWDKAKSILSYYDANNVRPLKFYDGSMFDLGLPQRLITIDQLRSGVDDGRPSFVDNENAKHTNPAASTDTHAESEDDAAGAMSDATTVMTLMTMDPLRLSTSIDNSKTSAEPVGANPKKLRRSKTPSNDIDNYTGSLDGGRFDFKTFIVLLIIPIIALLFAMIVRPVVLQFYPYASGNNSIEDLKVKIEAKPDNSIVVHEDYVLRYKYRCVAHDDDKGCARTPWHGFYKTFDLSENESLEDFQVYDSGEKAKTLDAGGTSSITRKQIFFNKSLYKGEKKIKISYRITGFTSRIQDASLLNYMVFDNTNSMPVKHLSIDLTWSKKSESSDNNWGYMETSIENVTKVSVRKDGISFSSSKIPRKTSVVMVALIPKNATDSKVYDKLDSNAIISKTKPKIDWRAIIIALALWVLVLASAPISVARWKRGRDYDSITYCRDLDSMVRPEVAANVLALDMKGRTGVKTSSSALSERMLSSGIMSLVNRKTIRIDENGGLYLDRSNTKDLSKFEKSLLKIISEAFRMCREDHPTMKALSETLNSMDKSGLVNTYNDLIYYPTKKGKGFFAYVGRPSRFASVGSWGLFALSAAYIAGSLITYPGIIMPFILLALFIVMYLVCRGVIRLGKTDGLFDRGNVIRAIAIIMMVSLMSTVGVVLAAAFACHLVASIAAGRNMMVIDGKMKNYHKIMGLYKYLDEASDFSERDLKDVVLWEQYMVYAAAFGLTKKVAARLNAALALTDDSTRSMYDLPSLRMSGVGAGMAGFHDYGNAFSSSNGGSIDLDSLSAGLSHGYVSNDSSSSGGFGSSNSGSSGRGGGSSAGGATGGGGMESF